MPHWLDQYAKNHHEWRETNHKGRTCLYRPSGLVETAFDSDGIYFEGRADINALLDLEINSNLTDEQLRDRIILAWTVLRLHHALLMSTAVGKQDYMEANLDPRDRYFLICPPQSPHEAIEDASRHIVFSSDQYKHVDSMKLYRHAQNTARVVDASRALARVFVLPVENLSGRKAKLRFLFIMSHQITDGITNHTWLSHFVKLLNTRLSDLQNAVTMLTTAQSVRNQLPLPQEDLYPPVPGSRARKRWFWILNLVLRHVKTPMPAAFANPLRRTKPLKSPESMPPTYDGLLNYTRVPPLNTFTCFASVSRASTQTLHRLSREVGASIGAGCFVLVAMVMMSLYETRSPDIPLSSRQSFIGSFPINPRPFFNHTEAPNSMMLAFSDGIVLPFLPSDLDVERKFKLLVRLAHKQLSLYQKRKRAEDTDLKTYMGSRGAGRVIAMNYIGAMERLRAKLPEHLKESLGSHSPQGDLTLRPNPTMATCGVSSVGRSGWKIGEYDVNSRLPEGEDAFIADYRGFRQNVRARDGEFLVGISGDDEGISANVSYDGNSIDEELVREWKTRMQNMLAGANTQPKL
ncbi:hypothetical protein BDV97DRAFT_300185 [Delphinella strobiligena]|nr:hypothetical protein BDV97DRAFT_300185 [Delphinella strobiligena]